MEFWDLKHIFSIQKASFKKSEVAIASLLRQTKQPKKLLQVKTITKSLENGIAESGKSCYLDQKVSFKVKKMTS